jgi:hypothetical protein
MELLFRILGSRNKPENPEKVYIVIPYCLKSPNCPCGRYSSECISCGLCDVQIISEWAKNRNFKCHVVRDSDFYESYLPHNIGNIDVMIGFACSADYIETAAQELVSEYKDLSLILVNMKLSCRVNEIEKTKKGGAKLQNFVENLESALYDIEKHLGCGARKSNKGNFFTESLEALAKS